MAVLKMNIGLDNDERKAIADKLAHVLADNYTLYLKTQNYHWNVTGSQFVSLHALFEQQYTDLAMTNDEIAERIRALGHPAPGSYTQFQKLKTIEEASGNENAKEMLEKLIADQEIMIQLINDAFATAEKANDQPTMDLLTGRLNTHEKAAWMMRSLLA